MVPRPAGFLPVADQVFPGNDMGLNVTVDQTLDRVPPRFLKIDSIDALQNINSRRWLTYLKTRAWFVIEIFWAESVQWCPKVSESTINGGCFSRSRE